MDNGYSLSDVAAATGNGMNGFGGEGLWIFALLLLLFGSNGIGFGGGSAANAVSQADLQRAVDLNSIQEGQAAINNNIQRVAYEGIGATKDAAYNNLSEIRDNGALISTGFANMQNCCCDLKQTVMENRYLDAQNTAAINANTTAAMQKVLDTIQAEKIASLQSEVSELKTQNMFCGIPRVSPYGYQPVWANGCGCNNI